VFLIVTLIAMEMPVPTSADTSERRHSVLRTRREWSLGEKRAIVAESRLPGANVSAISRRHGAAQSLIYQWRKTFGPTASPTIDAAGSAPKFLPMTIATLVPPAPSVPAADSAGMIEIVLANGRRVRADASADPIKLARLVAALDGGA
jgi:transposase